MSCKRHVSRFPIFPQIKLDFCMSSSYYVSQPDLLTMIMQVIHLLCDIHVVWHHFCLLNDTSTSAVAVVIYSNSLPVRLCQTCIIGPIYLVVGFVC